MERLLSGRNRQWPDPIAHCSSPYFELIDLSLVADAKRAREVLRAFLETCPREPATAKTLDAVEKKLRARLPRAYREFVMSTALADFEAKAIAVHGPLPEAPRDHVDGAEWQVDQIYGVSIDPDDMSGIVHTLEMRKEWGLPKGLVLLEHEGHTFTALDYRSGGDEPCVVIGETDEMTTHVVARTFAGFVAALGVPSQAESS